MTLLTNSQIRNLSESRFAAYCEEFSSECDLRLREHRVHAGDLIKRAVERRDLDPVVSIADALVIS